MKLKYAAVFERTPNNYCAYAPDLPGCISTAQTWVEMQENIRDAIAFHIAGIYEDGDVVPEPRLSVAQAAAFHNQTTPPTADDASELIAVVAVEVNANLEPAAA